MGGHGVGVKGEVGRGKEELERWWGPGVVARSLSPSAKVRAGW